MKFTAKEMAALDAVAAINAALDDTIAGEDMAIFALTAALGQRIGRFYTTEQSARDSMVVQLVKTIAAVGEARIATLFRTMIKIGAGVVTLCDHRTSTPSIAGLPAWLTRPPRAS